MLDFTWINGGTILDVCSELLFVNRDWEKQA